MWKGAGGTLNYSWNNNQDVKMKGGPVSRIPVAGQEMHYSVNKFSNGQTGNNYWSSTAKPPTPMQFGQTEWTRLWANKCFPLTSLSEESNEGSNPATKSPPISVSVHRQQDHGDWNLSRSHQPCQLQTTPSRVVRLSCWENGSNDTGKFPKKSVDPVRRFNEVKIKRDSFTRRTNKRIIKLSEPRNAAVGFVLQDQDSRTIIKKEHERVRVRRSPPPPISIGPVKQKINKQTVQNKWDNRLQQRKMRFEHNLDLTLRPTVETMTLDQVIAANKINSLKMVPKPEENKSSLLTAGHLMKTVENQSDDKKLSLNLKITQQTHQTDQYIIIDGPSVAFEYGEQMYFDWKGIHVCVKYFTDYGCNTKNIKVAVPEEKLRKGMTKNEEFVEELKRKDHLLTCRENADYNQLVLDSFNTKNAVLISNDFWKKPKKVKSFFHKLIERVFRFSFGASSSNSKTIEFSKTPFAPNGPNLEEFLFVKNQL